MPRELHDVFRMRLPPNAFLRIETLWTFHLYDSGAQVDIERQEDAITTCPLPQNLLAEELTYKYIVCDCTVAPLLINRNSDGPKSYSCELYVAKCNSNGETSGVWFSLVLSPSQGITGTYQALADEDEDPDAEDEGDAVEFTIPKIARWRAAKEPVRLTLGPLTCGKYTVEGAVVDDEVEGMVVPAVVHLELLPGGRLVGHSEEHDDEAGLEMIPLTGSWARNTIELFKAYELEEGVRDVFLYRGQISQFRFTGHWVNVDGEDVQAVALVRSQRFDMHVTKMQRRWSPQDHSFFPEEYREAVKLCLLSSLRGGSRSLPSVVWPHVFEFCDSEWFL